MADSAISEVLRKIDQARLFGGQTPDTLAVSPDLYERLEREANGPVYLFALPMHPPGSPRLEISGVRIVRGEVDG